MRKYFNKYTIFQLILFIVQTLSVAWCISDPNIGNTATYVGLFTEGFIFAILIDMFINSK